MRLLITITSLALFLLSKAGFAQSNDHVFPASAVAKPYIDFDSKGFLIHGKRTFLVSAGMEYARVPRALWKDRLQRLQMAGFNCIEIYTFWNYHEPQEGKFNFSGDHDLNAFLQLVHNMGMYCIARVGPYYCAEWDFGGYPAWLRFKEGVKVREPNAVFEKCVDHFMDTLLSVVCRNQINQGGAVIMVQLENEHPLGWGTVMPNSYFEHLRSYALSKGLQVPYFFSGLHHSSDPAGDNYVLDDSNRPNPWFSTEFWSVWYNAYGSGEDEAGTYRRRTWKIIAGGGNGYNYYMAHGGSNFGYTNNDEDAASYDYGAAVGQAGDLRPVYFAMKEAALFARSFENILENSTNASSKYSSLVKDTFIYTTARTSRQGDIVFLDNKNKSSKQVSVLNKTIVLESNEIYPLVHNYPLTKDVTIDWSFTRIYALYKQGNTINIILSGNANDTAAVDFSIGKTATVKVNDAALKSEKGLIHFQSTIPASDEPASHLFQCGNQIIRIICLPKKRADKTWLLNNGNLSYIVCGPAYASGIRTKGNQLIIDAEQPWRSETSDGYLFTKNRTLKLNAVRADHTHPSSVSLSSWQYKNATQPTAKEFNDNNWLMSKNPAQMGADGDTTADAWYRTNITVLQDTTYTFQPDGNGRATAYIDGAKAASWHVQDGATSMHLTKGSHILSVFVAHDGRDKLASYIGAVDSTDSKGLFGETRLVKGNRSAIIVEGWKYKLAASKEAVNRGVPDDTIGWKPYAIGQDVFNKQKGCAWFKAPLPVADYKAGQVVLFFKSVDENATVFINRQQVAKHEGWNQKFSVVLHHLDTLQEPLYLTVFIENYDNEGGIDRPVTISIIPNDAIALANWRMKGGTGDELSGNWAMLPDTVQKEGPAFYRTHFNVDSTAMKGTVWRVKTNGLGHGSVWVNGHNLGRYPEKISAPGMYIPDCWLQKGDNTMVVYDEDGRTPNEVKLQTESAASRDILQFTAQLPNP